MLSESPARNLPQGLPRHLPRHRHQYLYHHLPQYLLQRLCQQLQHEQFHLQEVHVLSVLREQYHMGSFGLREKLGRLPLGKDALM